jgi:RNA polymerase primary sigma factor
LPKNLSRRNLSLLDLIQEGNIGLFRAVDKFDYRKGLNFPRMRPGGFAGNHPGAG